MALHCAEVLTICLGSDPCSASQWAACRWREPHSPSPVLFLKDHFCFSWTVALLSIVIKNVIIDMDVSSESTRQIDLI